MNLNKIVIHNFEKCQMCPPSLFLEIVCPVVQKQQTEKTEDVYSPAMVHIHCCAYPGYGNLSPCFASKKV